MGQGLAILSSIPKWVVGPNWGPPWPNHGPTGAHMECCLGLRVVWVRAMHGKMVVVRAVPGRVLGVRAVLGRVVGSGPCCGG